MSFFKRYRQSIFAKLTAIGFIVIVVLGNVWLTYALVAHDPPNWLMDAFLVSGVYILVQISLFLGYVLYDVTQGSPDPEDEACEKVTQEDHDRPEPN